MENQNLKREFSAGCVVFKESRIKNQELRILFLLGKHSGYHKWVLAKGLIEKGEEGWRTALRETEEEMGVTARLVNQKPIHKVQYMFYANYKPQSEKSKIQIPNVKQNPNSKCQNPKPIRAERRVKKYQEDGGKKTKVFKAVSFYLAEYVAGDPKNHDWEMEEAGWFDYKKALKLLAFKGEKEALKKAKEILKEGAQGSLF